jgi:hypothetical protein
MRFAVAALLLSLGVPGVPVSRNPALHASGDAAGRLSDWSAWLEADGDSGVGWRWRPNTYGAYITPDCEVEFINSPGEADFRYAISFDGGAYTGLPKRGNAYRITTEYAGGEFINGCSRVRGVAVSNVRRR